MDNFYNQQCISELLFTYIVEKSISTVENPIAKLKQKKLQDLTEEKLNNKKDEVTTGDMKIVGAIEGSNAAAANATVNAYIDKKCKKSFGSCFSKR